MVPARLHNTVRTLISKGDTKTAIHKLQQSKVVQGDPELSQYVTLIAAHYQQYKKDEVLDVNAAEYQRKTLNRINSSILHLINNEKEGLDRLLDLERSSSKNQEANSRKSRGALISMVMVSLALILYFSGILNPKPSIEKEPKISYELKMLNEQGAAEQTFLVHIYEGLSGEFISNGNTQKISRIREANESTLDFTLFNNTDEFRYTSFLPDLSRVEKGNFTFLDGALYYNGQFNRRWRAYVKK